ncbi:MAG: hypothetical protein JWM93_595 [Frankiales bacterium]|nr:hypothetical protein [Frankiales bacterium]
MAEATPAPIRHLSFVMDNPADDVLNALSAPQVLDVLEAAAPTAQTVVLAHALQSRTLSDVDRSRLLSVWVRIESWVTARTDIAIVDVAGEEPASSADYGREEAALAMRLSPRGATSRVAEARQRTGRLSSVGRALGQAVLTRAQAYDLTTGVLLLDDRQADEVCRLVLPLALRKSRAEFRTAISKAVLRVDADGSATRHEQSQRDRTVRMYPLPDGMADLCARLTAVEAQTVYDALHTTAVRHRRPGDRIDNARADALVGWADNALADPALHRTSGRRHDVRVTITFDALLGLTNDPAFLDGYGPIHPMIARAMAPGSTLRRMVTDALSGELLDLGRTTYRAPQALADFIDARDTTCSVVGCGQLARRCDLDHLREWQHGGTTGPDNLHPLCERHHVMRHTCGWEFIDVDGELMLRTPLGRTYLVHREPADPSIL